MLNMKNAFFQRVQAFTPIVCDENMSSCEMYLILKELNVIIQKAPLNKSPGPDGLPLKLSRDLLARHKRVCFGSVQRLCTER